MKTIKICSEKQDNGLWGTPLYCYSMDGYHFYDNKRELLNSALIMAISETWCETFKVYDSTEHGFSVKVGGEKRYNVHYCRYEVINNTLYEFDNEKEHKVFLRKNKLKQLTKK